MTKLLTVFRILLALLFTACFWTATQAKATTIEYLMVPSTAMGRDIPVAFQAGGPRAAVMLDAFDAAPDVSNWVTSGNAMNEFDGKGIAVVAPAGGAWSMYTNWEQDGTRQWDTFLSSELPKWLATHKGLAPNGHAVIGASQGGTAALTLAVAHPDVFRYAGSMSGFLNPSATATNGPITDGMARFGGVDTRNMWGAAQLGRWKWHDPNVHIQTLVDNNTRLWIYSPSTTTCSAPAAMLDACAVAQGSNKSFYTHYRDRYGVNAHVDFPTEGNHDWNSWRAELAKMSADVAAAIK